MSIKTLSLAFTSSYDLSPPTMSSATVPAEQQTHLRQRRGQRTSSGETITNGGEAETSKREEVVWGKTPGGEGVWSFLKGYATPLGWR